MTTPVINNHNLKGLYKNLNVNVTIDNGTLLITMPSTIYPPESIVKVITELVSFKRVRLDSRSSNLAKFTYSKEFIDDFNLKEIIRNLFFQIGIVNVSI